jgi:hypothetical protein
MRGGAPIDRQMAGATTSLQSMKSPANIGDGKKKHLTYQHRILAGPD